VQLELHKCFSRHAHLRLIRSVLHEEQSNVFPWMKVRSAFVKCMHHPQVIGIPSFRTWWRNGLVK
jgi:hypothetical protein